MHLFTKAQWIVDNDYAGFMLWSLDEDDFDASECQNGTFPITQAIADIIRANDSAATITAWDPPLSVNLVANDHGTMSLQAHACMGFSIKPCLYL